MRRFIQSLLCVLLIATMGFAADEKSGPAKRDRKRVRNPKSSTSKVPAKDAEPSAPPESGSAEPSPEKPADPGRSEDAEKSSQESLGWRAVPLKIPEAFAKRNFESPRRIEAPVGPPPSGRLPKELKDLQRAPDVTPVRLASEIDFGKATVSTLALSHDGLTLAIGTTKGAVSLWNVAQGIKLCDLESFTKGAIRDLCLSPDGKHLAVGAKKEHARVFDATTGRLVHEHKFFRENVQSLTISGDSEWLYAIDGDGRFGVFPLLGGEGIEMGEGIAGASGLFLFAPRKNRSVVFGGNNSRPIWGAVLGPTGESAESPHGSMQAIGPERTRNAVVGGASDHSVVLAHKEARLCLFRPFSGGETPLAKSNFREVPIQIGHCDRCALTPNDSHVLALSHSQGILEIHPLEEWKDETRLSMPVQEIKVSAISADAHTIAVATAAGPIKICRLDRFPEGALQKFSRAMRDHLARREFERLDEIADRLISRKEPWELKPQEFIYDTFLDSLSSPVDAMPDPASKMPVELIEEWRAARPHSVAARLLLARREMAIAWRHRGGGAGETVTPEGWKQFQEHAELARGLLEGIPEESTLPPTYDYQRLRTMQALGWDLQAVDRMTARVTAKWPDYMDYHELMAFCQLARWMGTTDADAEKYAARIAEALGGAEGDAMYARIAMSLTGFFPKEKFFEATEFDADRIRRGLAGLMERQPQEMLYRNLALKLAWYREDAEEAARLFEGFAPTDWREGAWKYSSYRAARDWAKRK